MVDTGGWWGGGGRRERVEVGRWWLMREGVCRRCRAGKSGR